MKISVAFVALSLCMLSTLAFNPTQAQQAGTPWGAIAGVVVQRIGSLFDEGVFDLFGHTCNYKVKPTVKKFKLVYAGKAWCPGWTSIDGGSRKKSKNGAIENAISDLVNKLRNGGLVTDSDAQDFLSKYNG